jgi:NCS1 family nucleobase:cation symporter-1
MGTVAQYSWFIGMGVGLVTYYLLGSRSAVTATSLRPVAGGPDPALATIPAQPAPEGAPVSPEA